MRRALAIVLALLVLVPRDGSGQNRFPRRWLFAGVGVAFAATATAVYDAGDHVAGLGWCTSTRCVAISSTVFGVGVGFLVGREVDERYAMRYRAAPPIELASRSRLLRTRATMLERDHDIVAAFGDDGVELVEATAGLAYRGQRARGLRDITAAGVAAAPERLLVGASTGLYLYSLRGDAAGRRTVAGEIGAVAPRGDRLAVALGGTLRLGTLVADSVVWQADSGAPGDRISDVRWQEDSLVWVLTESALTAYRVDSSGAPQLAGRVEMQGTLRRLGLADTLAAVAAGADGVYLVHIGDPAEPREIGHWTAARYVYDAAVWNDLVAVGAGPEGLYLLQPRDGTLAAFGLSREAGFVAALAPAPDALFVLDRTGAVVRRFLPPGVQQ